jgi:hypothetical protein
MEMAFKSFAIPTRAMDAKCSRLKPEDVARLPVRFVKYIKQFDIYDGRRRISCDTPEYLVTEQVSQLTEINEKAIDSVFEQMDPMNIYGKFRKQWKQQAAEFKKICNDTERMAHRTFGISQPPLRLDEVPKFVHSQQEAGWLGPYVLVDVHYYGLNKQEIDQLSGFNVVIV